MKELNIGNLTIKTPIIQGGMGVCVSLAGLFQMTKYNRESKNLLIALGNA